MDFMALAAECAPQVSPHTLAAIVKTESRFNPFAIGVNYGGAQLKRQPVNKQEAINAAKKLLSAGKNIDMGLAQINSANMKWVGKSVEQLFDPCENLKAAAFVLNSNFAQAKKTHNTEQKALMAAISAYNTGSFTRGFKNGYVTKVVANFKSLGGKSTFIKYASGSKGVEETTADVRKAVYTNPKYVFNEPKVYNANAVTGSVTKTVSNEQSKMVF